MNFEYLEMMASTFPVSSSSDFNKNLTDSQKLDRLLSGFEKLQTQYKEIKKDHKILREECKQLREENKRLRDTLRLMSANSGQDLQQCEQLLQEIEELKDTVIQGQMVLEQYKEGLRERNAQLEATLDALRKQQEKKCRCLTCKLVQWWSNKKHSS